MDRNNFDNIRESCCLGMKLCVQHCAWLTLHAVTIKLLLTVTAVPVNVLSGWILSIDVVS